MKKKAPTTPPRTDGHTKHLEYIKNTGGNPMVGWFDDDWEPVGPAVREKLVKAGLIKITNGRIYLTGK